MQSVPDAFDPVRDAARSPVQDAIHQLAAACLTRRRSLRTISFNPDQTGSTAATLTSTKSSASAASRTRSSVTSVGTFAAFLLELFAARVVDGGMSRLFRTCWLAPTNTVVMLFLAGKKGLMQ
jgi:hypothetical protein